MRSCCAKELAENRKAKQLQPCVLAGKELSIDGYNVLITIESAISGAYVFIGNDGCFRDLAGLHGTYRKVSETIPAISLINSYLAKLELSQITWLLDRPVSNSGRLKKIIELYTSSEVILTDNPDVELKKTQKIVASSDSIILDSCKQWFNLAAYVITQENLPAKIIDLSN
jgi:hypothetical protein